MPRKFRVEKPRLELEIMPAVRAYLDTGDLGPARAVNVWLAFSLDSAAGRTARECWLLGDQDGAKAALGRVPGERRFLFRSSQ